MVINKIVKKCFPFPKRRSSRVQDITQRQEAQKIMAENQKKEQEALEKLHKLKYGDKVWIKSKQVLFYEDMKKWL